MQKIIFLFISGLLLVSSCKKSGTASPSTTDLLTAKTWKATALSDNSVASAEWCWMNNLYTYSNSGYLFEEKKQNIIGCSGDPVGTIYKSYWKLSPDNKWIITQSNLAIPPDEADSFKIISLDATSLKTERYVNKGYSYASTWAETFTAQ